MRRVIAVFVALVIIVAAAGLIAVGSVGISIFGPEGTYEVEAGTVSSRDGAVALVADVADVDVDMPYAQELGEATLGALAQGGKPVFIGLGPQAAIDDYLFGLPFDVLTANDDGWTTRPVPGVTDSAAEPGNQEFWIYSDSGTQPTFVVDAVVGSSGTLVIMNADGSPGVAAEVTVGFTGPRIFPISVGAAATGGVLLIVGLWGLFRWGRRSKKSKGTRADKKAVRAGATHPEGEDVPAPSDTSGGQPSTREKSDAASARDGDVPAEAVAPLGSTNWFRDDPDATLPGIPVDAEDSDQDEEKKPTEAADSPAAGAHHQAGDGKGEPRTGQNTDSGVSVT